MTARPTAETGPDLTAEQWFELSRQEDDKLSRCQTKMAAFHLGHAQLYAMYALYEQGRQQMTKP